MTEWHLLFSFLSPPLSKLEKCSHSFTCFPTWCHAPLVELLGKTCMVILPRNAVIGGSKI